MKMDDKIDAIVARNKATMKHWMRLWVHNSIANHSTLMGEEHAHSLYELKDVGRLRAAIVVGGGATLDDILDDEAKCNRLREVVNSEQVIMLCPNSVVRPLAARGIKPYAYISMHPTGDIVEGFRLGPNKSLDMKDKKLITATAIHPNVLKSWLGIDSFGQRSRDAGEVYLTVHNHADPLQVVHKVDDESGKLEVREISSAESPSDWYGAVQPLMWNCDSDSWSLFPWQKRGFNVPMINNMGCVVNYGIMVASILGCGPILTIGSDFSYVPDKDGSLRNRCDDWIYEDGAFVRQHLSADEHMAKIGSSPIKEAPGINGGTLYCSESMVSYRGSITSIYQNLRMQSGEPIDLVNCSTDGIITDLPKMELMKALDLIEKGQWWSRKNR